MSARCGPTVVFVTLLLSQALSQEISCTGSLQPLISGNRYRVEDNQFSASSSYSILYLPHESRIGGNNWCSAVGQAQDSWLQVDFGTDVIIHNLEIGGYNGIEVLVGDYYLRQFVIEYGSNTSSLTPIRLPNSTQEMIFTRDNTHNVRTTILPAPIITRVLRIKPVDHRGDEPCVRWEANGCVQLPGNVSVTPTPPTTPVSVSPSASSSSESTSTVTMTTPVTTPPRVTMTTSNVAGASTAAIAGGTVGGVVVLLLLLLVLVLLVGCLLAKRRKRSKTSQDEVSYSKTGVVRIVDNDMYGMKTPPTTPTSTDKSYGLPSQPDNNAYESIKSPSTLDALDSTNTTTYESIDSPKVRATGDPEIQIGSMVDNVMYATSDVMVEREALADNPMYGEAAPGIEKKLIDNPLYEST